ncbi:MAG: hypothetical protein HOI95_26055 [Chromatiales bacterium]|jgi:hypothetical protein|nr:hypothetical protein [Chromatiales bacterium]
MGFDTITWVVILALAVAVLAILVRRRRAPVPGNSAYGRWQSQQTTLWHGRPVTVVFDYAPYMKEPERRKVNVHTLQESGMGERSLVGFCHDGREDRSFKLAAIQGPVLVAKTGEEVAPLEWLDRLTATANGDA